MLLVLGGYIATVVIVLVVVARAGRALNASPHPPRRCTPAERSDSLMASPTSDVHYW